MDTGRMKQESARVNLSPEVIKHLKGIARAATQDEWIKLASPYFENEGAYLITTNGREEAGRESIAKVLGGEPHETTPSDFMKEQRANAAHIAAFQPAVALALCNRIESLRRANVVVTYMRQAVNKVRRELEAENARLEREAEWLAKRLAWRIQREFSGARGQQVSKLDELMNPAYWREVAREAVAPPAPRASYDAQGQE